MKMYFFHHEILAPLVKIVRAGRNGPLSILGLTEKRKLKENWVPKIGPMSFTLRSYLSKRKMKENLNSHLSVLALCPLHARCLFKVEVKLFFG